MWARIGCTLVISCCLLAKPLWAQTQNEQEQLKEKIQQLEQLTQELKARIAALEKAQSAGPQVVNTSLSQAQDAQRASSQKTVAATPPGGGPENEIAVASAAKASQTQTNPEAQKAEPKPGMDIYGFAQLDMGYDFKVNDPNWFDVNRPSKLPAFPGQFGRNGNTYFSVRQTRFGVKGSYPTAWGELKTTFEFDMFGVGKDAGVTTIRPRHYYGELGPIVAGQTNSTFMDVDVFPNVLDYWGPNGMVFIRNPQLRWMPVRGDTHLWIALEIPGQSGDEGVLSDRVAVQNIRGRFPFPDLTGQYRYAGKWGYIQGAAVLRGLKLDDTLADQFDLNQSIVGWGFNASSGLKVGKDTVHLQYVVGNGIENYMNDAPFDVAPIPNPANVVRPVKGKPLPMWSYVVYLDHNWSDKWATSMGYSALQIQNTSLQTANAFHKGQYSTINLLYTLNPHVMYGGELQWARRLNFLDGFDPNDFRIQFSFKYSFDHKLGGAK
jgi:outer membrane DcaP-like protein